MGHSKASIEHRKISFSFCESFSPNECWRDRCKLVRLKYVGCHKKSRTNQKLVSGRQEQTESILGATFIA